MPLRIQKWVLDPWISGLFTTIWRQTAKPCFFANSECHRPKPQRRRSTVNSTMDHAKLAKLQAQAASNRIGTSRSATSGNVYAVCGPVCLSRSFLVMLTASAHSFVQAGRAQCGERLCANRNLRTHRTTRSSRVR